MSKLKNKVAVITGGSAGIGYATAQEFIAEGATVIITGRRQEAIDQAVEQLGPKATGILSDARKIGDTEALVRKVKDQFGKVDILFVNAGVFAGEPIGQLSEKAFDDVMDVNFKGAVFTTEKMIPLLPEGASVIHLSSISSVAVAAGTAIYAASKAALNAYSRSAAIELAPKKIRVNAINPGMVATDFPAKAGMSPEAIDAMKQFFTPRIPLKRYAEAEEIAKLASFLASDEAGYITGAAFTIDGGATVLEPYRS